MTANNAIFIDPRDSVATALRDLDAGERLDVAEGITLTEPVARGHKIAVVDLAAGAPVIKFGFPIGTAKAAIARGAHVHSHNMATALTADCGHPSPPPPDPATPLPDPPTFLVLPTLFLGKSVSFLVFLFVLLIFFLLFLLFFFFFFFFFF